MAVVHKPSDVLSCCIDCHDVIAAAFATSKSQTFSDSITHTRWAGKQTSQNGEMSEESLLPAFNSLDCECSRSHVQNDSSHCLG